MSLPLVILFTGFLYIVVFGGYSLLRREGLSVRFAIESLLLTIVAFILTTLNLLPIHPAIFLLVLYLVTMRVRLLVDLGNFFAMRGKVTRAQELYTIAEKLWPDPSSHLIVQVNRGTMQLQKGDHDEAIVTLKSVLDQASQGHLGVKYETAAHYNLAVAYRRKGMESQADREFHAAIEAWPVSEYARRAANAIEQGRLKK